MPWSLRTKSAFGLLGLLPAVGALAGVTFGDGVGNGFDYSTVSASTCTQLTAAANRFRLVQALTPASNIVAFSGTLNGTAARRAGLNSAEFLLHTSDLPCSLGNETNQLARMVDSTGTEVDESANAGNFVYVAFSIYVPNVASLRSSEAVVWNGNVIETISHADPIGKVFLQLASPDGTNGGSNYSTQPDLSFGVDAAGPAVSTAPTGPVPATTCPIAAAFDKPANSPDAGHFFVAYNGGDVAVRGGQTTCWFTTDAAVQYGAWTDFILVVNLAGGPTGSIDIFRRDTGDTAYTHVFAVSSIPTLSWSSTAADGSSASTPKCCHYWRHGVARVVPSPYTDTVYLSAVTRATDWASGQTGAFNTGYSQAAGILPLKHTGTDTIAWTDPTTNTDGTSIAGGEITNYVVGLRSLALLSQPGTYPYQLTVSASSTSAAISAISSTLPQGDYAAAVYALTAAQQSAWSAEYQFTAVTP